MTVFVDLPLLRRMDLDRSGRIEDADLQAAYVAYYARRISSRELGAVWQAWFTGGRFQPRLVTPHPGDDLPTLEARRRAPSAPRVDLTTLPPTPPLGGYRMSG